MPSLAILPGIAALLSVMVGPQVEQEWKVAVVVPFPVAVR